MFSRLRVPWRHVFQEDLLLDGDRPRAGVEVARQPEWRRAFRAVAANAVRLEDRQDVPVVAVARGDDVMGLGRLDREKAAEEQKELFFLHRRLPYLFNAK